MKNTEIERVFLAEKLPENLHEYKHIIIKVGDFFQSNAIDALKIKQKGDTYELVKKEGESILNRTEHTITIKKEEFELLWKSTIQNHERIRHFYPIKDKICEIDIYLGKLKGYVRLEVEFKSKKEAELFEKPAWFGEEITSLNHQIHKDLGLVTFEEMKKRYAEKGIVLKRIKV